MMAAAKPSASRRGTPESLSTSGSMPDTPHSPPATSEVGRSKPAPVATTAYPAPMALENVTCVRKSATARVERVLWGSGGRGQGREGRRAAEHETARPVC